MSNFFGNDSTRKDRATQMLEYFTTRSALCQVFFRISVKSVLSGLDFIKRTLLESRNLRLTYAYFLRYLHLGLALHKP